MTEDSQTQTATTSTVTVRVDERGAIDFNVAANETAPPYFCLGVRKSGSTLLNRIVVGAAKANGINIVDVPGQFFKSGYRVTDWQNLDLRSVVRGGNVYGGFRSFPTPFAAIEAYDAAPKVFMFRDPRDALVSQFFSDAYSHSLPSAKTEVGNQGKEAFLAKRKEALETDIDTYVLEKANSMQKTLMEFEGLLADPTCLLLRYEEYIFQKKRMIGKILDHFGWTMKRGQIERLMGVVDQVPTSDDKTKFIRNVVPGDHRRKLKEETIQKLDNRLSAVLSRFDYY
jgi:hypothetical protein